MSSEAKTMAAVPLHIEEGVKLEFDIAEVNEQGKLATEKVLNRKFDFRILPCLFLLYFFSFMDRASIGNASIAGLNADLKLQGQSYSVALALFFICYLIVDLPAGLVFKIIGPRPFLCISIFLFGTCTICLGFVKTASQLYAVRCLLGLCEGGLTPCIAIYMGMFYPPDHLQRRLAVYYCAAPLSGAVGGLLASGLGKIQVGSYRHWPWIFFIEGAISMIVGVVCFFILPNMPGQSRFLTEEEREVARIRSGKISRTIDVNHEQEKFTWAAVKLGLLDWNTILLSTISIGTYCNIYAYSLFSPAIIKSFGYSTIQSQLLSVPPYIFGTICVFMTSIAADHVHIRGPFVLGPCCIEIIGWIIQMTCKGVAVRYFGLFLVAGSIYPIINSTTSWLIGNLQPHYVRATGMSFAVTLGTTGGIISTFTYANAKTNVANGVELAMTVMVVALSVLLMWLNHAENKLRARGGRDYRLNEGVSAAQLGSRHPDYVLSL
ncbi:putative transporter [Fonsecaea pedrosoi]|nr:putative transporter [Fonsecaea pedrosoi]